jgi:hypothetical protein
MSEEQKAKQAASMRAFRRLTGMSPTKLCPRCKKELPRTEFRVRANGCSYLHTMR